LRSRFVTNHRRGPGHQTGRLTEARSSAGALFSNGTSDECSIVLALGQRGTATTITTRGVVTGLGTWKSDPQKFKEMKPKRMRRECGEVASVPRVNSLPLFTPMPIHSKRAFTLLEVHGCVRHFLHGRLRDSGLGHQLGFLRPKPFQHDDTTRGCSQPSSP